MKNKELAAQVGATPQQISTWKRRDQWDFQLELDDAEEDKQKSCRGAPKGNKNAAGHESERQNAHAEKSGRYSAPRLADLTPAQQMEVLDTTCDYENTATRELQRQIAKELDLENRIAALRKAESGYDACSEGSSAGMVNQTVTQVVPGPGGAMTYTTLVPVSTRIMELEQELGRTQSRLVRLLDGIKSYQMELARLKLEQRRLELSEQKITGEIEIPEK